MKNAISCGRLFRVWIAVPLTTCIVAGLCFIAPAVHAEEAAAMQSVKTVYLVRHAEKANEKEPDPVLSEQGAKRAAALSQVLRDVPVSSIFCTPYKRSQETAKPLADAKKITISNYRTEGEVVRAISESDPNASVLVVGHSNTVPNILRLYGSEIKDDVIDEYDNLFVISIISRTGDTTPKVSIVRLRFPADWPR